MTFMSILKKFSIVLVALLALGLTRIGISYLIILVAIGIIIPIIADNKKSAMVTGALYATLGYLLSYPSGLFLINYMPDTYIPISVSSLTVLSNLFLGWIIPVIIAIVVCGIFAVLGNMIKNKLSDNEIQKDDNEYYFEKQDDLNQVNTNSLNKNQKKDLLYLTPIQKAKNRNENDEEKW